MRLAVPPPAPPHRRGRRQGPSRPPPLPPERASGVHRCRPSSPDGRGRSPDGRPWRLLPSGESAPWRARTAPSSPCVRRGRALLGMEHHVPCLAGGICCPQAAVPERFRPPGRCPGQHHEVPQTPARALKYSLRQHSPRRCLCQHRAGPAAGGTRPPDPSAPGDVGGVQHLSAGDGPRQAMPRPPRPRAPLRRWRDTSAARSARSTQGLRPRKSRGGARPEGGPSVLSGPPSGWCRPRRYR